MTDGVNKYRGYTLLQLGTETKRIKFSAEVFAEVEPHLGFKIGSLIRDDMTDQRILEIIGFKELRVLIWGGLRGAGSILGIKEVGQLMDATQFGDNMKSVFTAIGNALGSKQETADEGGGNPLDPIEKPLQDEGGKVG